VRADYHRHRTIFLLGELMTACFLCDCELMPETSMPRCEGCVPTDEDEERWEEHQGKQRAREQSAEQTLAELKKRLEPLAHWLSNDYNKWRVKNPKAGTYADACKCLIDLLKEKS
jgi:hypothetical protein